MPVSNPTTIEDCVLWLDAADPLTLFQDTAGTIPCTNNTRVSLWVDKSTKNNHFSNNWLLSSKPTLCAIGMQNQLSAVFFNNTFANFLTGAVTGFRYLTGGATVFSVCQPLTAAEINVNSAVYWGVGNIGTAGGGFTANRGLGVFTSTSIFNTEKIVFAHDSSVATSGRLGSSTYRRYADISEIITITIANTGTQVYQNSLLVPLDLTSQITITSNTAPSAAGNTFSDNMVLNGIRENGRITPGPATKWQEFIIYNRALSLSERVEVEDYIKAKWNLETPVYNAYGNANGNWSNSSTWLNSTLPTSASDVWANGRSIDIDTDVTVLSLRTTLNGGGFNVKVPLTINMLGDGIITGTNHCVTSFLGGTNTLTVLGTIRGSSTTANMVGVYNAETGVIRCISPNGVRAGALAGAHGATPGDTGTLFITGPCYGSDAVSNAYGVFIPYIGYVNIVGNIFAGTQSPGVAFNGGIDLPCILYVTGNIFASSGSSGLRDVGVTQTDISTINLCSSFRSGSTGLQAIDLRKFLLFPKPYASFTQHLTGVNSSLVQYSAVDDWTIYLHPEAKDTALGVRYGALTLSGIPFQLEGTMGIPDRTAVEYNTPVGNTLGVGIVSLKSLHAVWHAPSSSLKINNTVGRRGNAAATIKEFGDYLAAQNI
jgi:hypothetical protein